VFIRRRKEEGLEREKGFEPLSIVSSAPKIASLTLAEGASPLAHSPRRGRTPFGTPVEGSNELA